MQKYKQTEIKSFLEKLNKTYLRLHKSYENNFWKSYMGQPEFDEKMSKALSKKNQFQANEKNLITVRKMISITPKKLQEKLQHWERFFTLHQTPAEAMILREDISKLENTIAEKFNFLKEGYVDPKTGKFKKMSKTQMGTAMRVEDGEEKRKAYFQSLEKISETALSEYVKLVGLRNQYARTLGYDDFYAYKSELEDGMTKDELFSIFENIYDKTKYAFDDVRTLEKTKKGLRKPWNFHYMMAGSLTQEEDQYFQLDKALTYWGQAFTNMGIDMANGKLQLDLIARKGKYNNGFCHAPDLVHYENGKRIPGSTNFTCNAIVGQVGSGSVAMNTLFHEGGHAAQFMGIKQTEVCLNHEYLPMTASWAEVHSMFLDSVFSSIEWKTRYAHNDKNEYYPIELLERKLNMIGPVRPLFMMGIHAVMQFERDIYETKNLSIEKVTKTAKKNFKKFFDRSEDSLWLLSVPHIYSFESSCTYHGYGLAQLGVSQWRNYFYKKYGHIVDNKNIGKEMKKTWELGASKKFPEYIKIATGKKLSPNAFIKNITQTKESLLKTAKKRIKHLHEIKKPSGKIDLKADITMVHGTKKICNNKKSFSDMATKYAKWLGAQK